MDRPSYRDAWTYLKRGSKKEGKKGKRKREKEKGREKKKNWTTSTIDNLSEFDKDYKISRSLKRDAFDNAKKNSHMKR